MPAAVLDIIQNYRTCEFTTLSRDGSPGDLAGDAATCWRTAGSANHVHQHRAAAEGAHNSIGRNPKVSLLFSEPTGSGTAQPGAVLIQGDAAAEDRIVTDVLSDPDLAALTETAVRTPARRVPSGARGWAGGVMVVRTIMRLLIYVTPRRALFWPTRGFTGYRPRNSSLEEVRRVG